MTSTSVGVAGTIKDPVVRASTLAAIGTLADQPGPDQIEKAEAVRERAPTPPGSTTPCVAEVWIGPITLKPLPRTILWPAAAAVVGLVLGVIGVPIIGAYGDAVGRSLAQEVGAARQPAR